MRIGQRMPHLQFDGTAKHSVYATAQQRTKRGTLGSRGSNNTILDGLPSRSVAAAQERKVRRFELPALKTSGISLNYRRGYQPQFAVQPFGGTITLVPPPRVNPT